MPLGLEAAIRWLLALLIVVPLAWVGARAYARVWGSRWAWAGIKTGKGQPSPGGLGRVRAAGWRGLRSWFQPGCPGQGELVVEDGVQLGPGQAVYVVRVGEQRFLIGATPQSLQLLSRIPGAEQGSECGRTSVGLSPLSGRNGARQA